VSRKSVKVGHRSHFIVFVETRIGFFMVNMWHLNKINFILSYHITFKNKPIVFENWIKSDLMYAIYLKLKHLIFGYKIFDKNYYGVNYFKTILGLQYINHII
jgi:hypothetical protein